MRVFLLLLCVILALSSCSHSKTESETTYVSDCYKPSESISVPLKDNSSKSVLETVSEGQFHQVYLAEDNQYYYSIFDKEGDLLVNECSFNKPVDIYEEEDVVKVSLQTGTGIYTKWTFFYHTKKDVFSRVFLSEHDSSSNLIVYESFPNKLIIRNIFDKSCYYKEITSLSHPLSEAESPFLQAKISEDEKELNIIYLSGENREELSEIVPLDIA